jgi:pimeloyl-ACP methyl ester carboxylesterase
VPSVAVAGVAIHYLEAGAGAPVVCLVHGSGAQGSVWTRQLEGLADVARVLAPDLPGHGESGGEGATRIADSVEAVRGFLDALGVARVVLGGHSMGGAVAQAVALAYPERLAGLVLVGTGARLRVMPEIFERLARDPRDGARFVVEHAVAADVDPGLAATLLRVTAAAPPAVLAGDFRACDAFDVMDRIAAVRVPTLVVCGAEDRLTPPRYATFLRDQIRGARLALIPGAGHYVQLEQPDETTEAIRAFLDGLRDAGA